MQAIPEMIDALLKNPQVVGLVEFGSKHQSDEFTTGDYDLLVILNQPECQVKSLHFHIGHIPVDLNLRTIHYLRHLKAVSGFERVFLGGRIIYDPTGEITSLFRCLSDSLQDASHDQLTENAIARIRHWHRHVLDKVRGRLASAPMFCSFLLNSNILWLVENYFRVRHRPYKGPKAAFEHLQQNEPEVYQMIQAFYTALDYEERIRLTRELTELILQPVNGMWRDDEVLAFGDDSGQQLQGQGQRMFMELFGDR